MHTPRRLVTALTAVFATTALTLSATAFATAQDRDVASGVDVSGHQHVTSAGIDWASVSQNGQSFAFIKATEGDDWTNDLYSQDIASANEAGLQIGTYHYARPGGDARQQARHYAQKLSEAGTTALPPVLDLEVNEGKDPQQLVAWTHDFMDELKAQTGRTPMLYTYRYFWKEQMANSTEFSNYPLWLAAYQDTAPAPVGGWNKLDFWQRSDSGRVNGITGKVDMNLFNGDRGQLNSFASGNLGASGGALENYTVPGEANLGGDASALITAILALAAGAVAAPQVVDAAQAAGVSVDGAQGLIDAVQKLAKSGQLPVNELNAMADGHYSVGDLAILLDNATHVAGVEGGGEVTGDEVAQAQAADASQVSPDQVASMLSRIFL